MSKNNDSFDDFDSIFDSLDENSESSEISDYELLLGDEELDDSEKDDSKSKKSKGKKSKKSKGKKSPNKRKSPIKLIVSLILVGAIGFGGYYSYSNGYIDKYISKSKEIATKNDKDTENKTAEEDKDKKTVDLQLVNAEQVLWTEQACNTVSKWGGEPLRELEAPPSKDGFNSVQAKNAVKDVLKHNSLVMRNRAKDINATIKESYEKAKKFEEGTILTDNNKKVGASPDPHIVSAASAIALALNDYADSLDAMVDHIDSHATYDFYGHRDTIAEIQQAIPGLNNEFSQVISSEINNDLYDNPVTMERVSQLPSCDGTVIDKKELNKEYGDILKEQENAREFINYRRCEAFMDNQEKFGSDNYEDTEQACKKILSGVVMDESHPATHWNIKIDASQRAIPKRMNNKEIEDLDNGKVTNSEDANSGDSKEDKSVEDKATEDKPVEDKATENDSK